MGGTQIQSQTGLGRKRERAGVVIRESHWEVVVFLTSAILALFPGYFALEVVRGEKG